MIAAQRRKAILETLGANGAVSLRELAESLGCSDATVRRDLRRLEEEGLLGRSHGGAVATWNHEPTFVEKARTAQAQKDAIGALAATMVADGDAIVIGPGTTTLALARELTTFRDLTVVTNSLLVASALDQATGVEVHVTGGTLRGPIRALVGTETERALRGLHVRLAFISGNGLTAVRGLSTPARSVAGTDMALAAAAGETVVLADHTKIGVDATIQTLALEAIDTLITDDLADKGELRRIGRVVTDIRVAESRP